MNLYGEGLNSPVYKLTFKVTLSNHVLQRSAAKGWNIHPSLELTQNNSIVHTVY